MQQTGVIVRVLADRHYGFLRPIYPHGAPEVFFHQSGFVDGSPRFDSELLNRQCTYDVEDSPKGPRATNIRLK